MVVPRNIIADVVDAAQTYFCIDLALVVNAEANVAFESLGEFSPWRVAMRARIGRGGDLPWVELEVPNQLGYECALTIDVGVERDMRRTVLSTINISLADLVPESETSLISAIEVQLGAYGRDRGVAHVGHVCLSRRA